MPSGRETSEVRYKVLKYLSKSGRTYYVWLGDEGVIERIEKDKKAAERHGDPLVTVSAIHLTTGEFKDLPVSEIAKHLGGE